MITIMFIALVITDRGSFLPNPPLAALFGVLAVAAMVVEGLQ